MGTIPKKNIVRALGKQQKYVSKYSIELPTNKTCSVCTHMLLGWGRITEAVNTFYINYILGGFWHAHK